MNLDLFETVVLCWWLALGAVGHMCWCVAYYRHRHKMIWWCLQPWSMPLAMAGGLFTLGAAVCFEPGKDLR